MKYSQLTQEQRYQIAALLKMEHSKDEIARVLEVDRSTIYREVKRDRDKRGYRPKQVLDLELAEKQLNSVPILPLERVGY